ncbi:hypothetical protein CCP1ISM_130022 [Azospirillaceae bacterium]
MRALIVLLLVTGTIISVCNYAFVPNGCVRNLIPKCVNYLYYQGICESTVGSWHVVVNYHVQPIKRKR